MFRRAAPKSDPSLSNGRVWHGMWPEVCRLPRSWKPRYLPDLINANLDPLLAASAQVLCGVLCLGTLMSASWVAAHARLMADPTEAGQLALGVFRWRSLPLAVLGFAAGVWWLVREQPSLAHQKSFIAVAAGVVVLAAMVLRVTMQARRVTSGVRPR